jgi:hypothetical protein
VIEIGCSVGRGGGEGDAERVLFVLGLYIWYCNAINHSFIRHSAIRMAPVCVSVSHVLVSPGMKSIKEESRACSAHPFSHRN